MRPAPSRNVRQQIFLKITFNLTPLFCFCYLFRDFQAYLGTSFTSIIPTPLDIQCSSDPCFLVIPFPRRSCLKSWHVRRRSIRNWRSVWELRKMPRRESKTAWGRGSWRSKSCWLGPQGPRLPCIRPRRSLEKGPRRWQS